MRRHLVRLAVATAALLVWAPSAAVAGTTTVVDPRGDAPARHDLTSVRLRNDADRLGAELRVRDLRGAGDQVVGLFLRSRRTEVSYAVTTHRGANGRVDVRLDRSGGPDDGSVPCDVTARWSLGRDRVTLSVPRSCVPELTGQLRMYVVIGVGDGTAGDPVDWTREARVPA